MQLNLPSKVVVDDTPTVIMARVIVFPRSNNSCIERIDTLATVFTEGKRVWRSYGRE